MKVVSWGIRGIEWNLLVCLRKLDDLIWRNVKRDIDILAFALALKLKLGILCLLQRLIFTHQWIEGNFLKAKCGVCEKNCGSVLK